MNSYEKFENFMNNSKSSSLGDLNNQVFGYSEILKLLNAHYTEIGFPSKGMIPFIRSTISENTLRLCICDNLFVPKLSKKQKYNADCGKSVFLLETKDKQEIHTKTMMYDGNILWFNYVILEYSILPLATMKNINRELITGNSQNISFAILQDFLKSQNILIETQLDLVDKASAISKSWFGNNYKEKAA